MHFQIRELILWPTNGGETRRLKFEPGKVNVISGASKTGKSAIIPIIDYCLGSERCAIPVGVIRQSCSWFGLIIETAEGQKLLARREPGDQRQTENMFVLEGPAVVAPQSIARHNTDVTAVKAMLNRLAGIPNLGFDPDSQSGFKSRASIRDMMAFLFQPQNIVANPDVFFFKADTAEHREKLKTIFPYVLGAITADMLIAQWELDALKKVLRRKEKELNAIRSVSLRWQAEAQSWLDRAKEYGLAPAGARPPVAWPDLIDALRRVSERTFRDATTTAAGIDASLLEISQLNEQEQEASATLFELRQRLKELDALKTSAAAYGGALTIQRDRLALSTWLRDLAQPIPSDPVVGPALTPSADLDRLCDALARIEAEAATQPLASETIDKELLRVRASVREAVERLGAIRARLKTLLQPASSSSPAYSIPDIERFLGRLQQALQTYETVGTDSELAAEVERLRQRIAELSATYSEGRTNAATARALQSVQTIAATILPKLDAEWPDKPIKISVQDLSIRVVSTNREDWLWEIGSGANWLAYHVAVSAALQRFFMQTPTHPVPHLLVYDQPSQVYFPRRAAAADSDDAEPSWRDEDTAAVRKVFSALADEVVTAKGRLQVLILDHADKEVWEGLSQLHLVEKWRAGIKLVPEAWIEG